MRNPKFVFLFAPLAAFCVLLCVRGLLAPLEGAEEAWRNDGRRFQGTLRLDGGELRFQPSQGEALAPTDLTRIRFPESTPPPFRAGSGRRIRLWDGERITGQVLELNKDILRLRTAWARRLDLPRAAVAAVEPLPGWRTIFDGTAAATAVQWRTSGEPARVDAEDGTAERAFLLRAAGQSLTCTLQKPLSAGRVGVNFQERGQARGGRWTVELRFQRGDRVRRVTVTLAGDSDQYEVDAGERGHVKPWREGTAQRVAKTPGWHRLIVQFRKNSLRLTCDDDLLWYNLDEGPSGSLQRVTIACHQTTQSEAVRGAVAWTEFSIERAVDEHPQPPAETEQDSVRLLDDDQLFGSILQADRHTLHFEGRFGKLSLPWTAISGCSFRRPAAPPKANEGAKVRLFVRSGLCPEPDVLEGVVTALDNRRLIVRHALLGELTFERGQVRELRPLPRGSE